MSHHVPGTTARPGADGADSAVHDGAAPGTAGLAAPVPVAARKDTVPAGAPEAASAPAQWAAEFAGPVLRSSPFGLLPHVGWRTLAPLAINGAALTHGHPEAQTAAAVQGFVVHAAVRARREA